MKNILLFLALMSLTPSALASDKKTVSYKSGDETVQGILCTPQGKGPFPALIVIHEWWGLNDWIKQNAKAIAEKGYVAFAPDLYRGKVTEDPMVASQLRKGLPECHDARLRQRVVLAVAHEHPETPHPLRLLRTRSERPRRCAADKRDERTPVHCPGLPCFRPK